MALDGDGIAFVEGIGRGAGDEVGLAGVGEMDAGGEEVGFSLADAEEAGIERCLDADPGGGWQGRGVEHLAIEVDSFDPQWRGVGGSVGGEDDSLAGF